MAARALTFARLAPFVRPALVNGAAGVVVAPRGEPFSVMGFTVVGGRIVEIDAITDPSACARWTWPCSTTDAGQGAAAGARSTARSHPRGQLRQRARVDVVGAVVLAIGHVGARGGQGVARGLAELDTDDRVAPPVGDPHRQAGSIEVGAPALDGRDEAAHGHDPRRRRAPGAEPEGVGHDRALREAAEDRALPRHAGELRDVALQELVGGAEGVGVGEADARHHVPVATARRQEERPAGREADEPALGIEEVEEGGEVVLVGPAPVHEHERALRLARRRADLMDELGHAVVSTRGLVSGVSACSSCSRRASYCGGSLSASPRVSSGSS